ncbi:MAG: 4-(cytidine 5'-diphospho)-2-C-methyl-D-erythritol kinase [Cyclobacteriaceae bacterium]
MVSFPNCKINLGLHVLSKREDGFHEIETCFYPVPWADVLEVIPSNRFTFISTGLSIPGATDDNLCVRAYKLLQAKFKLAPVAIHLHKVVPMGAGLGAGSSDAAFTLKSINEVFELRLDNSALKEFASNLGSDCSFFIENKPLLGKGKGNELEEVNVSLKGKHLVIVKPPIHVSTKDAYSGMVPKASRRSLSEILGEPSIWKQELVNDFEASIFKRFPEIELIKNRLYELGAYYACMSGSGSSVYGLFEEAISLEEEFHGMTCWGGQL